MDAAETKRKDFTPPPRPRGKRLSRIMEALGTIEDTRQKAKVRYPIAGVILLVVAAVCGKAATWTGIEMCGKAYAHTLRRFPGIRDIPSHDTIERVMSLVNPEVLLRVYPTWCDRMDFEAETPESLRGLKLPNLDGKTMRGGGGRGGKQVHVESAWDPQRAMCPARMAVDGKSNGITAIPQVLSAPRLEGCIVTSDAMGTQTAIARQIVDQGGGCVLAPRGTRAPCLMTWSWRPPTGTSWRS